MNVVMIGPFGLRPKGTMNARALPMAKALAKHGHSITLLIPPWDYPADAGRVWEEDGVRIINLPLPPGVPLLFHGRLALRLVGRALALHPDVIHCFKPKAYAGLAHFILWWRRLRLTDENFRLVVDEDDCERAWNEVETYSPVQKRFFAWQERWGLTHADAIVVASRELIRLVEGVGVPPDRIFYVPNGVRPSSMDGAGRHRETVRMRWDLADAPVVLLYTRFFEFRLERIVEILRRIVAQEPHVKLLVVGKGLFNEELALGDMLAASKLSGHAIFAGWVELDQLPDYFAAADVAIFPADDTVINRARCSVKLTDLLAAGLPVVADAVGQNAEYIVDGESGLLVRPEDDAAFAAASLRLLADADLRARIGAAAAGRMRECFSWQDLVVEVERAYQ